MNWGLEDKKNYTTKSSLWTSAKKLKSHAKWMIAVLHFNTFIGRIILWRVEKCLHTTEVWIKNNFKKPLHAALNFFTTVILRKVFYHCSYGIFCRIHFLVKTIIFALLLFSRRDFNYSYSSSFPNVNKRVKYSSFDNINLYNFFKSSIFIWFDSTNIKLHFLTVRYIMIVVFLFASFT